jgi:hypothetical protein
MVAIRGLVTGLKICRAFVADNERALTGEESGHRVAL